MKVLKETNLISRVIDKEATFRKHLTHSAIRDIRSAGLLMAVELDNFGTIRLVIEKCLEKGLITDWFLFNDRSLRIAPPLIIEEAQIIEACGIIVESIDEVVTNS